MGTDRLMTGVVLGRTQVSASLKAMGRHLTQGKGRAWQVKGQPWRGETQFLQDQRERMKEREEEVEASWRGWKGG